VARAVNACEPLATVVEFQLIANGALISVPSEFPSTKNWTLSTRRSSQAEAATSTALPLTWIPEAGFEIETLGGLACVASV